MYYLIGDDKSFEEGYTQEEINELIRQVVMEANGLLPLAGGNMTGNIGFASGVRTGKIIRFIKGDSNGSGIAIGDGGSTIIGGGESAALLEPAAGNGATEQLVLANDTDIVFYVNCQSGLDSAVKVTLSRTGLLSGHQKAITSGTAAPSGGSNGDIYIQY